jgi:periplasmic protein TonB
VTRRLDVVIFLAALVGSLVLHVALIEGIGGAARRAPKKKHRAVEMALVTPPPPLPPPPAPEKAADLTEQKPKPKPKVEVPPPSNTTEAPPPDVKEPPKPVFGISMSSTVGPGSGSGFTVRVGNTLMKDPEKDFTPPDEVQRYSKPVALHEVTKMPEKKGECRGPFPAEARALGIEGSVQLDLEVKADGTVGEIKVVKGLGHGLDEIAVDAMQKCVFTPAEQGGRSVPVRISYKYTFLIED